jgi:hypothetical protein
VIKRLDTIRAITTAVATIIVAIALVIGAAGLIVALRRTMVDEVAEAARSQAGDVVRQLEAGRPPVFEVAGADEQLIQVMTPAVDGVYEAAAAEDADRLKQVPRALNDAWEAARAKGIPPQMESQMGTDIEALNGATGDWEALQSAALRISQNELDLRLLYEPIIDVDMARLRLWARQLPIDVAAGDSALVLANVAALDRVWERTRHGADPAAPVDAALQDLRTAADADDLAAVDRSVGALNRAVGSLRTR